ncbi:MAG: acyl-CoA dehydrogenase, partial [Desulfatitalea sp.]|nr:acyl-CoA dehydrogenase [Desulfatitalea sp.]
MAQVIAERKDIDFVLFDQLNVESVTKHPEFAEYNRKTIEMIINEARNLAVKELLPTQKEGDEVGCHLENGKVTTPESFKRVWDLFKEGEWVGTSMSAEWGGQGMPHVVATAAGDYFSGANFAFMMYVGLTNGAASLIENFGTDKLKKLFLKKMNTGVWTGTMLLTEPEAGSDVGALTSTAVKNPDGIYSITGNKIFISSGDHLNALNYARDRVQFRRADAFEKNAPAVPIIQHPDVRRMLMTSKTFVEGMRSLLYYVGLLIDKVHMAKDEKEKAQLESLLGFLTPICKGYCTDRAYDVTNLGMQVYGGYGFIKEYPQEQLVRDTRITIIYEGTNGIQALDLLGRKTVMDGGKSMMAMAAEIQKVVNRAKETEGLKALAEKTEAIVKRLGDAAMHLGKSMMEGKIFNALVFSYTFMEVVGDVIMAWMLLWRACIAAELLAKGTRKKDEKYLVGQVKGAHYYIMNFLPIANG